MGFKTSGRVNLISDTGVVDDELSCELNDVYGPRCYRSWYLIRVLFLQTEMLWRKATSQLRMSPQYDVYPGFNIDKLYGSQDPGKWMAIRGQCRRSSV